MAKIAENPKRVLEDLLRILDQTSGAAEGSLTQDRGVVGTKRATNLFAPNHLT